MQMRQVFEDGFHVERGMVLKGQAQKTRVRDNKCFVSKMFQDVRSVSDK